MGDASKLLEDAYGPDSASTADVLNQYAPPKPDRAMLWPWMKEGDKLSPAVPGIIHEPWEAIQRLLTQAYYPTGSGDAAPVGDALTAAGAGAMSSSGLGAIPRNLARGAGPRVAEATQQGGGTHWPSILESMEAMYGKDAFPRTRQGASFSRNLADEPHEAFDYMLYNNGKHVGDANGMVDGTTAFIDWIGRGGLQSQLGVKGLRQLREQMRQDFPHVTVFQGDRVSGARSTAPGVSAPVQSVTMRADPGYASFPVNILDSERHDRR